MARPSFLVTLTLALAGALFCACGSSQAPLYGPGPQYEEPNVPPTTSTASTASTASKEGGAAPTPVPLPANSDAGAKS